MIEEYGSQSVNLSMVLESKIRFLNNVAPFVEEYVAKHGTEVGCTPWKIRPYPLLNTLSIPIISSADQVANHLSFHHEINKLQKEESSLFKEAVPPLISGFFTIIAALILRPRVSES